MLKMAGHKLKAEGEDKKRRNSPRIKTDKKGRYKLPGTEIFLKSQCHEECPVRKIHSWFSFDWPT